MDHHPRHQNLKEITELCLGLPGAAAPSITRTKRVFADTQDHSLDDGDFNLKLQSKPPANSSNQPLIALLSPSNKPSPPKAQVVGWPPVRAHRQNAMKSQKQINVATVAEETSLGGDGALVKLSIDGAPYLRKVDLKMYKSYQELSDALAKLFSSFTKGSDGEDGMIDFMNESKSKDALNSSDFVKTYQDKDGDWMLVGDVPWEMFVNSCNRLRIMKKSEAKGLGNLRISNPMEKSS